MLTLIQDKATHPIPSLTYGSSITNAYIQIAQILKRATARPPEPTQHRPAPEPRVPINTPTDAEQRVPDTAPTKQQKTPLPDPHNKPSPPAPRNSPTIRPRLERRQQITHPNQFAPLAQTATSGRYANHIAALANSPPTAGKQGSLKKLLLGPEAKIWERSLANEWGRLLSHGIGTSRPANEQIKGTSTIVFITKTQVPQDRKVTYANFICNIRPQKSETHRVRMTAGGDKLDYPGDASSPTVSMLDAKIHINSTISDAHKGARHLGLDIKNYYLGTPMSYYQYLRVPPSVIPQEVWNDIRYDISAQGDIENRQCARVC
jgi:hypothetical protein